MSKSEDRSKQKTVKVYTTQDEIQARMIQEMLDNAGIESLINSEVPSSLFPMSLGRLGRKEIYVLESDLAEATRILAELPDREPLDAGTEPD